MESKDESFSNALTRPGTPTVVESEWDPLVTIYVEGVLEDDGTSLEGVF